MPAEDITLDATLTVNSYTVTFTIDGEQHGEALSFVYGAAVEAPAYTAPEGYSFSGWTVPETMPAENITLDASLTPNSYTVSFTINGEEYDSYTQAYGSAITAPNYTVPEGYTFSGWNVAEGATVPVNGVSYDATLTVNNYTITWIVDGVETKDEYAYGANIVEPETAKVGYGFDGWYVGEYKYDLPEKMPAENLVLTAQWTAGVNTVTWIVDGEKRTDTFATDEVIDAPADPTKAGYTFAGWKDGNGNSFVSGETTMPAGGVTYTAQWTANTDTAYIVETYIMDTEGNYGYPAVDYKTGTTATDVSVTPETKTGFTLATDKSVLEGNVAANGSLVLKVYYQRNQYTFKTVVEGTETEVEYYYGENVVAPAAPSMTGYTFKGWNGNVPATMPAEDVTLTAEFDINSYTVTFTINGEVYETESFEYGAAVTAPAYTVSEGHTFVNWAVPSTMPAENITLDAKLIVKYYTVTWNVDGVETPATYAYGAVVTIPAALAEPTKEGHTFAGWEGYTAGMTMPANGLTITAKWTVNNYTVTWNVDGVETPVSYAYGKTVSVPAPTKEGHTFAGWTPDVESTMGAADVTYTALWNINQYTITLVDTDGKVLREITQNYNTNITTPAAPVKDNFVFEAWETDIPAKMPAENLTIKALWTADNNNNKVADYNETATVTVNVTGAGKVALSSSDNKVIINKASENNYTVIYNSAVEGGNVLTVTATPNDTKSDDGSVDYVISAPATVALVNGENTVNADFGTRTIVLKGQLDTVKYNKALRVSNQVSAIEQAILGAVVDAEKTAGFNASTAVIKVYGAYDFSIAKWDGYYKLSDGLLGLTWGNLVFNDATETVSITLPAVDNMPEVSLSGINIKTGDSRTGADISLSTTSFSVDKMEQAADAVKAKVVVKDNNNNTVTNATVTVTLKNNAFGANTAIISVTSEGDYYVANTVEIPVTVSVNEYTIKFVNEDGTELQSIPVAYGETPVYTGATPTKAADVQYSYEHNGWTPALAAVTGEATYTATYKSITNKYEITWDTNGELEGGYEKVSYDYGTDLNTVTPPAAADRSSENKSFAGWTPEFVTVTGTATYTAVFSDDTFYTVIFKEEGENGTVYSTQNINVSQNKTVQSIAAPTKTNYKFVGWTNSDVIGKVPSGNVTLIAQWVEDKNNNNVADAEETATVKVEVTGAGEGFVKVAALADTTVVIENADSWTIIYDSTVTNGNKVKVIATATATGSESVKNYVSNGASTEFTLTNGQTATAAVEFGKVEINVAETGSIYISGALTEVFDKLKGLKGKVLDAAFGADSYNADEYTVYMVVGNVIGSGTSDINVETSSWADQTTMSTRIYTGATLSFAVVKNATGNAPSVRGSISVKVEDNRPVPVVDFSGLKAEYYANTVLDLNDMVKADIKVTVNGESVDFTATTAAVVLSEEGDEYTVTVVVEDILAGKYQAVTKTAKIRASLKTYTITWDPANGDEVFTTTVGYLKTLDMPTSPVKEATAEFSYKFSKWAKLDAEGNETDTTATSLTVITEDASYKAIYTETKNKYEVKFVNEDNTELQKYSVEYGEMPAYDFSNGDPVKPGDTTNDYKFVGWDPELAAVTGEATYTAKYEDADDIIYTVIFMADETEYTREFVNYSKGQSVSVPETVPTKENYVFVKWLDADGNEVDFEKICKGEEVENYTYTLKALWTADKNNNGVADENEYVTLIIEGEGTVSFNSTNNTVTAGKHVYDSTKELEIIAAAKMNGTETKTYLKSIAVGEGEQKSNLDISFGTGTAAYCGTAVYTGDANEENKSFTLTVIFEEVPVLVENPDILPYYAGIVGVTNKEVYDTVIEAPDYNDSAVTIEYLAREAGESITIHASSLGLDDSIISMMETMNLDSFTFQLGELWMPVTIGDMSNQIQNSVSLDTAISQYLNKETVDSLITIFNDAYNAKMSEYGDGLGALLGLSAAVEAGVNAVKAEFAIIEDAIYSAAYYYGAHNFGYNATGAETVTEKIRIVYKNDVMNWSTETEIVLMDTREVTTINASDLELVYRDYLDEELLAAIGATVLDSNGVVVSGAVVTCPDLVDPYTFEGTPVSDTVYQLKVYFAGDENYRPSEATVNVTVVKASLSMDVPDVITTYGDGYSVEPSYTFGNKYPVVQEVNDTNVQFVLGLDVADLEVSLEGNVTGLEGRLQVMLPATYNTILSYLGLGDGAELNLGEFMDLLDSASLLLGEYAETLGALGDALESITSITDTVDLTIVIGGSMPTDIGVYLHGAVTTNSNYETAYDVGYLVIQPRTERVYLDWNYTDKNGLFTYDLMQNVDLGATAYSDEAFTVKHEEATAMIHSLFFGVDLSGKFMVALDPNDFNQSGNGGYVQLAFIADFGNELNYAVPLLRPIVIVPNVVEVQLVGANGTHNRDLHKVFNGQEQGFNMIVTSAGKVVYSDHYQNIVDLADNAQAVIFYTGVQTNGKTYGPTTIAPTHAGAYTAVAVYAVFGGDSSFKLDELIKLENLDVANLTLDDLNMLVELQGAGMDAGVLVIEPSESTITMSETEILTFGEYYNVVDAMGIKASSVNAPAEFVTDPDYTVITASIAATNDFSVNGWAGITGNVNIDLPAWLDKLLDIEESDTLSAAGLLAEIDKVSSVIDEIIAKLGIEGDFTAEAEASVKANVEATFAKLNEILTQLPENTSITFQSDYAVNAVGAYAVVAIVTDSDHYPSIDAGLLVITPDVEQVYLKFDYEDENNIFTNALLRDIDLSATAYNDEACSDKNEAATAKIVDKFLTIDAEGNLFTVTDENELTNGAWLQISYIPLEIGGNMTVSDLIARPIVIVPDALEVQLVGTNGTHNRDLHKVFNGQNQGFNMIVTNGMGEVVYSDHYQNIVDLADNAQAVIYYTGVQTNGKTYGPTTIAPIHAGAYTAVAVYAVFNGDTSVKLEDLVNLVDLDVADLTLDDLKVLLNLQGAGMDAGVLVIEPSESTIEMSETEILTFGEYYNVADTMGIKASSVNAPAEFVTDPDYTVITASIAATNDFSVNGWAGITGNVNIDLPAWLDKLLDIEESDTLSAAGLLAEIDKVSSVIDEIIAKLGIEGDFTAEAEASVKANVEATFAKLNEILTQLPENTSITFQSDYAVNAVGAYAVVAIVTDSDHYPSVDAGLLVITPDVEQAYLKFDYEDENNIFTKTLLSYIDLSASAYTDKSYTTLHANNNKVVDAFLTIDAEGNLLTITDENELTNGAWLQISYIPFEIGGNIVVSDLIARPVVIIPDLGEVELVYSGVADNQKVFSFTFDGTAKALQMTYNGQLAEADDYTIYYEGIQTNGKPYVHSTEAPVHAGAYVAIGIYSAKGVNGDADAFGTDVALINIGPAASSIDVTGGTFTYDGEEHAATITTGGNYDKTIISGHVRLDGDIDKIGVDAFIRNVNIDFPRWIDEIISNFDFSDGINAGYLKNQIESFVVNGKALIPEEMLISAGLMTQDEIDVAVERTFAVYYELINLLDKMPQNISITFEDDITYTEPGNYYYYGLVTDSDRYPSADTGLLVIEKMKNNFDLLDTAVVYNGEERFVNSINEFNTDAFTMIVDRQTNTVNLLLESDVMYVVDKIKQLTGYNLADGVLASSIYSILPVEDFAAVIIAAIEGVETAEVLDLNGDLYNALISLKAELEKLPVDCRFVVNQALPINVGTYDVYALAFAEYYSTEFSKAVLTIMPAELVISASAELSKVYGEADPDLTAAIEGLVEGDELNVTVTREPGENVGSYAINITVEENANYNIEVVPGTLTIVPKAVTVTANDQSKFYGETDPELTSTVEGLANGDTAEVLNVVISRETGENVGKYKISASASNDNYTITVVDGTLTVEKKLAGITVDDVTTTYGDEIPAFNSTISGLVGEDELSVSYVVTDANGNEVTPKNAGTYTIAAVVEHSNYTIIGATATLTIEPKAITVVINDANKVYSAEDPSFSYTAEGLVGDDKLEVEYSYEGENAGEYELKATVKENANYNIISVVSGTMTIEPKAVASVEVTVEPATVSVNTAAEEVTITITAKDKDGNIVEDSALIDGTYIITDENEKVVTLEEALKTAGEYTITPVIKENANFAVEEDVVKTATLTVEAVGVLKYNGSTLSLNGEIFINPYLLVEGFDDIDASVAGGLMMWNYEVSEEEAVFGGAATTMIAEGLTASGKEYKQQTYGFPAPRYSDSIYMRFYLQTGENEYAYSELVEYSVREYCETVINRYPNSTPTIKSTCIALLHYGTAAQEYFSYNTGDPANKNIVGQYPVYDWDASLITPVIDVNTDIVASSSVKDNGKTLSLNAATAINYYFTFSGRAASAELLVWDGGSYDVVSAENYSYKVALTPTGSEYKAQINAVAAPLYGKTIYVCAHFVDENGVDHYSEIVKYSIEEYARIMIDGGKRSDEVCKRLVTFGEFARIHFGQ